LIKLIFLIYFIQNPISYRRKLKLTSFYLSQKSLKCDTIGSHKLLIEIKKSDGESVTNVYIL